MSFGDGSRHEPSKPRVHLVRTGPALQFALGDQLLCALLCDGCEIADGTDDADAIIVQTSAHDARSAEASIDAIVDAMACCGGAHARGLIVVGDLATQHATELHASLPEIDAIVPPQAYHRIGDMVRGDDGGVRTHSIDASAKAHDATTAVLSASSYLEIAKASEGGAMGVGAYVQPCAQRSHSLGDILARARLLIRAGARELVLAAPNPMAYGVDIGLTAGLEVLCEALHALDDTIWVRLGAVPAQALDCSLLSLMGARELLVPYLHGVFVPKTGENPVGTSSPRACDETLASLRALETAVLRASVIVPASEQAYWNERRLDDWIQAMECDHLELLNVENDALGPAHHPPTAPSKAQAWRDRLVARQRRIGERRMARWIGRKLDVLVTGTSKEHPWVLEGRHAGQARGIDGVTYLSFETGAGRPRFGETVRVEIDDASGTDLVGIVLET